MFLTPRVSTWPLNQGRPCLDNNEDRDQFIWALVPVSLLDDHRVRQAYSRALVNSWLGRHRRSSQALDIDLPFLVELAAHKDRRTSLRPEASSETVDSVPNSPNPSGTSPPVTISHDESRATLEYVGHAFPGVTFPGYRLPFSEGSRTPTSQSAISLSSRYLYKPTSQSRPATPSTLSAYVSWARPNSTDNISDPTRQSQRSSVDNPDQPWNISRAGAATIDMNEDLGQVHHFATPHVQHDRAQARVASREFPQAGTSQPQKRVRSPSPDASASNTNLEHNNSHSRHKRRRVEQEEREGGDALEESEQSPSNDAEKFA